MHIITQITLVAIGSALGGLARWGGTVLAARIFGMAFPWGTLLINLSGSLFLGWAMAFVAQRIHAETNWLRPNDLQLLLAVGFAGSFTTFSTFEYESNRLLEGKETIPAFAYMIGSLVLGLLAIRCGIYLARRF